MKLTSEEKEQLYLEFKDRMKKEESPDAAKSATWRNQHYLEVARWHFEKRANKIRNEFEFKGWKDGGLNWPDWSLITRLICHTYGVRNIGQLNRDILVEANNLAMELTNKLFDINEKTLQNIGKKEEINKCVSTEN